MKTLIASLAVAFLIAAGQTALLRAQEESKPEGIQITDAKLGKNIQDRMIVDEDSTFELNSKVFLWMKTSGGANDSVTVTWKTGDFTHAATLFIGGSPWRTWASKTVTKAGDWTVTVTDAAGSVLKEMSFTVK